MKKFIKNLLISLGFAIPGAAMAADLCSVSYEAINSWSGGAQQQVTVTNYGPALSQWQLSWTFNGSEQVSNIWNGTFTQQGSDISVSNASYNGSIPSNGVFEFGFVVNGTSATPPSDFYLNGANCADGDDPPIDDPQAAVAWSLDRPGSNFEFISVKNAHVAEIHHFDDIDATVDSNGLATLAIDLNSIESHVDIRNQRMRDFLFDTNFLPTLYYQTQLDLEPISALPVGASVVQPLEGLLSLHGVTATVSSEVMVTKIHADQISVSVYKPILISAEDFDMAAGVEVLRSIVGLNDIGNTVPVYFHLAFSASNDANQTPIAMPSAPATPADMAADFDADTGIAVVNWGHSNDTNTALVIRAQQDDGYWYTLEHASGDQTSLSQVLTEAGVYRYKAIALNGSVPSAPSPIAVIAATDEPPQTELSGEQHFQTKCSSCHGADGSGGPVGIALNTVRDRDAMISAIELRMPVADPTLCDADCARAVVGYIETTFWSDPNPGLACDSVNYGARQFKLLTRAEYQRSVEDLLGVNFDAAGALSADTVIGYFVNNTHSALVSSTYDRYLTVAEDLAQWSADRDFVPAINCSGNFNQDCANQFINSFAPRMIRRPLDADETATYLAMANGSLTGGDVKAGIQLALEALLASPQFLYRHELGERNVNNPLLADDAYELTSYEMATWLAYTFTGSTPDATTLQKASNDQLRSESAILEEARRLLDSNSAANVMGDFVGHWLGTFELENAPKDSASWPTFAGLIPHMKEEIRLVFADIMLDPNGTFDAIFSGEFTYVNEPLAQHYGITGVSGSGFQRVATSDRGGVLTSGAFMARWAEDVETSPIRRSVRVRQRMLCQNQPAPPANIALGREAQLIENAEILNDPTTTNRLKYHIITNAEDCQACHREWINPLGFGMEDFDPVGNPRSVDLRGNPIDAMGQLYAPERLNDRDIVIDFQGSRGLGDLLTTLPSAQACVPQNLFRFIVGVGVDGVDPNDPEGPALSDTERSGYACEIQRLTNSMLEDSPRAMLENMSILDAVRYRREWSR